jgi:hypothetical protein
MSEPKPYTDDDLRVLRGSQITTLSERRLMATIDRLAVERDQWKRRAARHGCDTTKGDVDCG